MASIRTDDGVALAYETHGEGTRDLLFMHGWAGSGAYFDGTIAHLDLARARAITFDLRGHGSSEKPEQGYGLDRIAADTIAVADAAAAESFVILGFSMSAKFAQYVALDHPQRVAGLVLVAGCPVGEIPLPPELLEDWYGRQGNADRLIGIVRDYGTQPVAPDVLRRFGDDAAKVPRAALEGTMNACISTSFSDRVGSLATPTLVVGGVGDQIFDPDTLRDAVVSPIANARLEVLDCGHEIPLEQPAELAELIEAFLDDLQERTTL